MHGYFQEMPSYGGYYYFRPYNYKHVLAQSQAAGRFGTSPMMPYSQQFWHRYQQRASMKQRLSQIGANEYATEMVRLQAWSDFLKQQQATQAQFQQPPANFDQRRFQENQVARQEYGVAGQQPRYANRNQPIYGNPIQPADGSQPQLVYGRSIKPAYRSGYQPADGFQYAPPTLGAQGQSSFGPQGQPPVNGSVMPRQPSQPRPNGDATTAFNGSYQPRARSTQNSAPPQRPVDPALYREYSRVEELQQQIYQQRMQLQALRNSLQQQQLQGGVPARR